MTCRRLNSISRCTRPGTIVDAGAHEGRLTLPLARLPASRVVAFEPLPPAFARLQKAVSAEWDGMIPPHVTLRREALAEYNGTTTIATPRIGGVLQEEWASIAKNYVALSQADARIEAIETWPVDVLALGRCWPDECDRNKNRRRRGRTRGVAWSAEDAAKLPSLPIDRDRGTPPVWQYRLPCRSGCVTLATRVGSSCFQATGDGLSNWISQQCIVLPRHRPSSLYRTHTSSASTSCRPRGAQNWPAWRDCPRSADCAVPCEDTRHLWSESAIIGPGSERATTLSGSVPHQFVLRCLSVRILGPRAQAT